MSPGLPGLGAVEALAPKWVCCQRCLPLFQAPSSLHTSLLIFTEKKKKGEKGQRKRFSSPLF